MACKFFYSFFLSGTNRSSSRRMFETFPNLHPFLECEGSPFGNELAQNTEDLRKKHIVIPFLGSGSGNFSMWGD